MGYDEKAVCPHCGKTATGHDEIEEKFGYRDMGELLYSRGAVNAESKNAARMDEQNTSVLTC